VLDIDSFIKLMHMAASVSLSERPVLYAYHSTAQLIEN